MLMSCSVGLISIPVDARWDTVTGMGARPTRRDPEAHPVSRVASGIEGFDDIADGGLPRGAITVVIGGAGAGKTIFGAQFLASRAVASGERGILVAFEESPAKIVENLSRFDWGHVVRSDGPVTVVDARIPQTVEQSGEFDLIGLLAVVAAQATAVGGRLVVFDGIDVLLGYLRDPALIRREIFRLREWVHTTGITAILTAKADTADASPAGEYAFLQFLADCAVTLHHRLSVNTAMRFLRVSKYRGARHSANEFPFTITHRGIEVASAVGEVDYPASTERTSTGVDRLDSMLDGGYYRGSSVLITGAPGTAKTSLSAAFARAAVERGERTLYVSFDESPEQIVRNALSIGIQLRSHVESGQLILRSLRGRAESPEGHATYIRSMLREMAPRNLVVDPLSALEQRGCDAGAEAAALRVIDFAKSAGITILSTSLLGNSVPLGEQTPLNISTIADTWMHLSYVSQSGERNRALTIIKSRGTGHSNQVRELILSDAGVTLADVYSAGGEVLMGTLRWEKENAERRASAAAEADAHLREQKAALVLAQTDAQLQTLTRARAIQEKELAELRSASVAAADHAAKEADELLDLRRADARLVEGADRAEGSGS
jgi:circadian clock protein KaiC